MLRRLRFERLGQRVLLHGGAWNPDAGTANDDLDTPADVIHPNIHEHNGPGHNANPNDGNAMHGIANVPGQSDADPSDGEPGFADQLTTVHGGIDAVNRNA